MAESLQYDELSDDQLRAIDTACTEFERALQNTEPVTIESLLPAVPLQIRMTLFRELLSAELGVRLRRGQTWDSGLLGHLLNGKLAFVDMQRHLRIGLVVCRVLLGFSIPVRYIIW